MIGAAWFDDLLADAVCRAPGDWPPATLLLVRGERRGIGLRSDADIPRAGRVRLLHWIVSPFGGAPSGGIVEDCGASRLAAVRGLSLDCIMIVPTGRALALPADRAACRNLVAGDLLLGLRGWDIPHDRNLALTSIETGCAVIAGENLPALWHRAWRLEFGVAGRPYALRWDGDMAEGR